MSILENMNSAEYIRRLGEEELTVLCGELRSFIIDSVSKTGGHLASNLGMVELTVALHRVYDTSKDRVVFDVGHQSYVHKIITGRKDRFYSLRTLGGISGFPKPMESDDDAFIAGHASNSISVALGMARARTLQHENYSVAAIIGDGALTGGLAYEGLSDAGAGGEPIVIILNDNGMSISRNVGGMARFLSKCRVRPGYLNFKRRFRSAVGKVPVLYDFFHNVKEKIKSLVLHTGMFEDLGFSYLGPVDGHDVVRLEAALRRAKEMAGPVVLHVITRKGFGYGFAEENPGLYHGVGPFEPETGITEPPDRDFASVFGEELCRMAETNEKLVAITAAMTGGTGLTDFSVRYPKRFFDVGIAEGHAVTMAAGMAKQGLVPVAAVYSTFLQRAYDMLIHDVSLQKLHVVLGVDRAGIVGRDGETHNGAFDVSYLTSVPNMAIFCPSSFAEMREMLHLAVDKVKGPAAIRYPRGGEGVYRSSTASEPIAVLREGKQICLISYGIMINKCLKATKLLEDRGYSVKLVKLNIINPLDCGKAAALAAECCRVLVVEDVCSAGCVGERILTAAAKLGIAYRSAKLLNLGTGIVTHGSPERLYSVLGLDGVSIADTAEKMILETNSEVRDGIEKAEA